MRLIDTLQRGSLDVDGHPRSFLVAAPAGDAAPPAIPIVVMLHGGMGSPGLVAEQTGLLDYVSHDRFIAVFPDAGGRQWSDGRPTTRCEEDDVAFLAALVPHVASRYGGDAARAYLVGGSNGGMMALRVACEATEAFRAYAAVLANLPAELATRTPTRAVPLLLILSTDDPEMPWAGGKVRGGKQLGRGGRIMGAGGRVLSASRTVGFFSRANGCDGEEISDIADGEGGSPVRVHRFRCSASPLVLYEIHGGGHGWPGSRMQRDSRVNRMFGTVSQEIDATKIILEFFKENGLSGQAMAFRPSQEPAPVSQHEPVTEAVAAPALVDSASTAGPPEPRLIRQMPWPGSRRGLWGRPVPARTGGRLAPEAPAQAATRATAKTDIGRTYPSDSPASSAKRGWPGPFGRHKR